MIYPGVSARVKAVVIDSFVLVVLILLVTLLFSFFDSIHDYVRIGAFVLIFGLYDPVMTSLFGGTIGHMIIGIRVKREKDETKNILFPIALIRFLIKASLGWISLLTVMSNKKGKALHDMVVKSIVRFNEEE